METLLGILTTGREVTISVIDNVRVEAAEMPSIGVLTLYRT